MKALLVAAGQDLGGINFRLKEAVERHVPGWAATSMHTTDTYLQFPSDIRWQAQVARRLYREASVVHMSNTFTARQRLGVGARRPLVIHHHGTQFRSNAQAFRRDATRYGSLAVVSTIDLLEHGPELEWLPSPQDVPWLARIRQEHYVPSERIRIAHAPTARSVKSTDEFLAAFAQLARKYPLDLVLVERTRWSECLRRKATADIFYDQAVLGYGGNALESWAMDTPVVCGASDRTTARMHEILGSDLPFYPTTPTTIAESLEALIVDADLRAEYASRGRAYVEQWHDYPVVAAMTVDLWQRAGAA